MKLLALQPGHRLHREQVLDALWPELDVRPATAQLYKTIHYVRQALASHEAVGDRPTGTVPEGLAFRDDVLELSAPGGVRVDVEIFERLASEALAEEPADPGAVRLALAHYGGDLLPADLYEEWTVSRRATLRETFLDLLQRLGDAHLVAGRPAEAADSYRRIIKEDPLREEAHRGLMRVFAAEGDSSRLVRQFERCRDVLAQELDVPPSPETASVYEELRATVDEGGARRPEIEPLALDLPGHLSRIVGRSLEIEAATQLVEALLAGKGSVLVLEGEPGIGKTRLALEVAAVARRRGCQVWVGGSHEHESRGAYGPVVEALRSAVRADRSKVELIPPELTAVIPELPAPGRIVPTTDRHAAQSELFASVLRFVAVRAAMVPVVMVLDDLHAADDESVALLHYLARSAASLRLLIVATVRTGEPDAPTSLAPTLASLERGGVVQTRTLAPVPLEDLSGIASQALGGGELDPQVAAELAGGSDGNPLFAVELARHMAAAARLVRSEGVWRFREPATERVSVPTSIKTLVDARVQALSPDALQLVRMAAVMGSDIQLPWLWAAFRSRPDADESRLLDALDEAVARQLLEETGAGCRFPHALIRQAIDQSLSPARRRALHGHVGKRLEELFRDEPSAPVEALARHFAEAGLALQAARYLLQAGDAAEVLYAHQRALQRYEEAIALLREEAAAEPEADEVRSAAWERTGDVHRLIGDVRQSQAAYLTALDGSGRSARMEVHRKVALASILAVDMAIAAEHLQAARELLDGDPILEARWLIAQALFEWHCNDLEKAAATGARALQLAEEAGATVEASQACEILALANLPMGNWEEGLRYELKRGTPDWSPEIAVAVDAHL